MSIIFAGMVPESSMQLLELLLLSIWFVPPITWFFFVGVHLINVPKHRQIDRIVLLLMPGIAWISFPGIVALIHWFTSSGVKP